MILFLPWLLEFFLESSAVVVSFRRRNWTLFSLVTFRAVADIATFYVRNFHGHYSYALLFWIFRAGQYVLLLWIACVICGKLLKEFNQARVRLLAVIICMLGSAFILRAFSDAVTFEDRFMDAEIAANFILAAVLIVGWISRQMICGETLSREWNWITLALVIQLGSRAVCTFLWMKGWHAAPYTFYAGDIAALTLWNLAGFLKSEEAHVIRLSVSPRGEALIEDETLESMVM